MSGQQVLLLQPPPSQLLKRSVILEIFLSMEASGLDNFFSTAVTIVDDEALGENGESGWRVILNSPTTFQNFILSIRCFDNPPAHIP